MKSQPTPDGVVLQTYFQHEFTNERISMSDNARIDIRGKSVDLPIVEGSEGELGLDISKLRAQSKTITLDPGYVNTGACASAITFLDGE